MSPKVIILEFFNHRSLAGPARRNELAVVLPLTPPILAFQVPVAAAFAVVLTGLVLCAATAAPILAPRIGEIGIA